MLLYKCNEKQYNMYLHKYQTQFFLCFPFPGLYCVDFLRTLIITFLCLHINTSKTARPSRFSLVDQKGFEKVLQHETTSFVLFVKMILSLFHGNAAVERDFSVNSEILVEKLSNESLIAQLLVYDVISRVGGVENVEVSKKMMVSVGQSCSRWMLWKTRNYFMKRNLRNKRKGKYNWKSWRTER